MRPTSPPQRRVDLIELPPGLDPDRVRAVFLDLDGTVLAEGEPVPGIVEAIARLRADGVEAIVATGRMLASAYRVAELLDASSVVIGYQGAAVGDRTTLERLSHSPLDVETARAILTAIDDDGHNPIVMIDDGVFVAADDDLRRAYATSSGVPYAVIGDLASWLRDHPTKVVVAGDPDAMTSLRDALRARFGTQALITKSLPHLVEIAAVDVHKAHGAEIVCARLGIDRFDTIAFGDGENDLELLEWAAIGAAVADGLPELVAAADWVVPPHDVGGVTQALDALVRARGA